MTFRYLLCFVIINIAKLNDLSRNFRNTRVYAFFIVYMNEMID